MLDDMMRRAAREAANPYDGRFMRFVRHMMYASINQAISASVSRRGSAQQPMPYEDERIDAAISNANTSKNGVSSVASILQNQGFTPDNGMDHQEYTSRALISIAKQFGATAEDIEKLLKARIESTSEDGSGPDSLGFIFTDVADEIKDLTSKIEKYLNLGKIKERQQEVSDENSEEARRKRKEREDAARRNAAPEETSIDRALNFVSSIFRKLTPGAEEAFQKQLDEDAKNPDAERRKPMNDLLKSFADFMGSPEIDEKTKGADLQDAINELTGAVKENTNAQGKKPQQSFSQRLLENAITMIAKIAKPVAQMTSKVVPQAWQNTLNRFAANTAARLATRAGINPANAARAAIAAGPLGWALVGVSVLGKVANVGMVVVGALKALAQEALKTVDRIAMYNGALMSAKVNLQVGRLQRDIDMAQYLSQRGSTALNMQNRMEQEWVFWERIKNDVGLMFSNVESQYFIGQAKMVKLLVDFANDVSFGLSPLASSLAEIQSIRKTIENWFADDKNKDDNPLNNTDMMKFHKQFVDIVQPRPQGVRQAPQLPQGGPNARQQMMGVRGNGLP